MDTKKQNEFEKYEDLLSQANNIGEVLVLLANQPKRQYSQQEIDDARGNLSLMNDRVFMGTFCDNKNNRIITEIVNALRKIHVARNIPPIERTTVQNLSLLDVLGRGMVGDLLGEGHLINITVEVQKGVHDGYAVRGTITSGNAMRIQWVPGDDFTDAPDVIGINILGFKLPELKARQMFCSRIVRAEYESKETFLADKYSDYYIELPKMDNFAKDQLPKEYHDLWDLCCIFKAKIKEHEEVINMQTITNPTALELSKEVKKAVAPNEFINGVFNREDEMEQLRKYIERREQKAAREAQEAAQKAAQEAAQITEQKTAEKMLVMALKSNAPSSVIEAMQKGAGITEGRLIELRKQSQGA